MRFENSKQSSFLGKWRYAIKLAYTPKQFTSPTGEEREKWRSQADEEAVAIIELHLTYKAVGEWIRQGNVIYVNDLDDAFTLRLFFDNHIEVIRKAVGPQSQL